MLKAMTAKLCRNLSLGCLLVVFLSGKYLNWASAPLVQAKYFYNKRYFMT